jgi:DNA-directed RNA polymerase subunit RPC12/RpoP
VEGLKRIGGRDMAGDYPIRELIEALEGNRGGKCSICGQEHAILLSVARQGKHDEARYLYVCHSCLKAAEDTRKKKR